MIEKIDIFESVKSDTIKELTPEILETGLDYLTTSEVLKAIPIFGIAFKSFSLFQKITESFFCKKLLKFLFELKDIPLDKREKFIAELETDNETNKAGEKILIILNRLNDIRKAEIIGRLFKETILGRINFKDFNRLTHIIDNAYIDDLILLKNNNNLANLNNDIKSHLHQVGLLNQGISDFESLRRISQKFGDSSNVKAKLVYEINPYCKILIRYGL